MKPNWIFQLLRMSLIGFILAQFVACSPRADKKEEHIRLSIMYWGTPEETEVVRENIEKFKIKEI